MAVQNSLARQDQSMKLSVYLQNDAVKKQINQVVGGKNGTRFISSIVSAVQSTPALQECTKDLRTGEVEAVEIGNQIPGQMSVQDVPGVVPEAGTTVVDGKVIDKATGEVVADSVPEHAGKVIDLRTAKQA